MNLREATAGIRRGHLGADDFSLLRGIIGSVATSSPEEIVGRINGSSPVGQALIYDLAFGSRDEMVRVRESLGNERLIELCAAIRRHIERPLTCPACRREVPFGTYTCQCGATVAPNRSRRPDARPTQELVASVQSGQTRIGFPYQVRKNRDGSLSCNCLGFMNQTHLQTGSTRGYAICRHMHNLQTEFTEFREPSEFQKAMLRSMGITAHATLTNDQAYFLVKDVLDQQGIDFVEYVGLLRQHGKADGLPIWTVGWEFEGGLRDRSAVQSILPSGGWNIGSDGSVRPARGFHSVEIRSPKLFGKESFSQMELVLNTCQQAGWNNTNSAGMHTHVNASMSTPAQRVALAQAWKASRNAFIQWLVPAHRRNNHFCQALSARDLRDIESQGYPSGGRYRDLNYCAFPEHGSIEVRLHQCSADAAEVKGWTIFLLKFFEAAMVKGTPPDRFADAARGGDINDLLDLIGMGATAVTPVKIAADQIRERFARFRADQSLGSVQVDDDGDEDYQPPVLTPEQRFWTAVNVTYNNSVRTEGTPGGNRVNNLLRRGVSVREPFSSVSGVTGNNSTDGAAERLTTHRWAFRSETTEHNVTWNSNTDEITCSCGYFRNNGFCRYSVAVARYLFALRSNMHTLNLDSLPGNMRAAITEVSSTAQPAIEPEPVPVTEETPAAETVAPAAEESITPAEQAQLDREVEIEIEAEVAANSPRRVEPPTLDEEQLQAEAELRNQMNAEARRLYENYSWSGAAGRTDTPVPVAVWEAAGQRVGRMVDFETSLTNLREAFAGAAYPNMEVVRINDDLDEMLVPIQGRNLQYTDRLMLRCLLAVLMASGRITRAIPVTETVPAVEPEVQSAPAAEPEANVFCGLPEDVFNRAKSLYENTRWAQLANRESAIPAEAWQQAGQRVSHVLNFNAVLSGGQDLFNDPGRGYALRPTEVPGHPGVYYLAPVGTGLSSYGRCLLRANLSVLIAQGLA